MKPLPKLLAVPGTTDAQPTRTPIGRWRERTNLLLGRMAAYPTGGPVGPYMRAAQELLPEMIQEVIDASGGCGPIAQLHLCSAAKLSAIANFLLDTSNATTVEGKRDILMASRLADAARLNSLDALKTAVAIANMKPIRTDDPLAAYLTVVGESAVESVPDTDTTMPQDDSVEGGS